MHLNFKEPPDHIVENQTSINSPLENIPRAIVDFWNTYAEIMFGNGILIYGYETAIERNETFEIPGYAADFLMIGDDSGGQGIFLKRDDGELNVYFLDLGAIGSAPFYSVGKDFFTWLQEGPDLKEPKQPNASGIDEDHLVMPARLYVTNTPTEPVKFLMDIRKEFSLAVSLAELKNGLEDLPYLLLDGFFLIKYREKITALNAKYNCLTVVLAETPSIILIKP